MASRGSLYDGSGEFSPLDMSHLPGWCIKIGGDLGYVNANVFYSEMKGRAHEAGITEAQWRTLFGLPEIEKITCVVCRKEKETSTKRCPNNHSERVCDECMEERKGLCQICHPESHITCAVCHEKKDIPAKRCPNNHPDLVCDGCLEGWKRFCTEQGGTPCPICRKRYY